MLPLPIFTTWWEIVVYILLGLVLAIMVVILIPVTLTIRFIEYIRKTNEIKKFRG